MTLHLPFEILTTIFEQVDDIRDLYHVRTASRTLCAAATPFSFRVLSVDSTAGSAQNLGRLFDVPDIAAHVREVSYRDTGADRQGTRKTLEDARTSAIPELSSSFSRIYQLPLLENINLTFFPFDTHERDSDIRGPLALQASILDALANSFSIRAPPKLISLSLHNLRASGSTPLDLPPFQTVMKTLRRIQLFVLFDFNPHQVTAFNRWLHFWGTVFPRVVFSPMRRSLTELILRNNRFLGASSGLSLSGLHFPQLCALSLCKIVFEPSVGVEPFILRHTTTLLRLELISCRLPVNHDNEMFVSPSGSPPESTNELNFRPLYWARIWDSFAAELTTLVSLHVDEHDDDDDEDGLEGVRKFRYVRPWMALSYLVSFTNVNLDAVDAEALQRFHETVAARAKVICGGGEAALTP